MGVGRSLLAALLAAVSLTAACGGSKHDPADGGGGAGGQDASDAGSDAGPTGCHLGFLGDPQKDPELRVVALGPDGTSSPVNDGDQVALIFPIQGGRVVFAGVQATNVAACGATLAGAIRDETSMQVRLDDRTINLVPSGDGWGGSVDADTSSFSNIPMCPNQWSDTDIFGTEYELIVSITDREQRTVTKTLKVTPYCAEPENEAQCRCICKGGYVLGESCDGDAGTSDAGSGDAGG